ncbi:MAG: hypothetical protein BWK76_15355 [Desulfobulbaceae bacterium A2]|nr:MAG: hypothetical protein BWK76_15355 [Desulfobulbaceae bacterium A2]
MEHMTSTIRHALKAVPVVCVVWFASFLTAAAAAPCCVAQAGTAAGGITSGAGVPVDGQGRLVAINPPGVLPEEGGDAGKTATVVVINGVSYVLDEQVALYKPPKQAITLGEFFPGDEVAFLRDPSGRITELWFLKAGERKTVAAGISQGGENETSTQVEPSPSTEMQGLTKEGSVWKNY